MNNINNSNIANKACVLKLNSRWRAVGVELVSKTICDLMTGVVKALDIVYALDENGEPNFEQHEYVNPVGWDEWVSLPVREWDFVIHSSKLTVRVPTVVITAKYAKVHEKKFRGKPTKEGLALRDGLIDAYSGKELEFETATIDHYVPLSRGGSDTYDNTVLTSKEINNRKGNKLNSEAGLVSLIVPYQPKPVPISHTIKRARHHDWRPFLEKSVGKN